MCGLGRVGGCEVGRGVWGGARTRHEAAAVPPTRRAGHRIRGRGGRLCMCLAPAEGPTGPPEPALLNRPSS